MTHFYPVVKYAARFALAGAIVLTLFFMKAVADYKGDFIQAMTYFTSQFVGDPYHLKSDEACFLFDTLVISAIISFIERQKAADNNRPEEPGKSHELPPGEGDQGS
jgi:hypothetical protein